MISILIALSVTIPFIGLAFALYLTLIHRISSGKNGPFSASFLYWVVIACSPWLITWALVPVSNYVFVTHPSLQVAAWDVGLALALYLGMCLSYLLGIVAGSVATWRFISHARRGQSVT